MNETKTLRGQRSRFRPKVQPGISMTFTKLGRRILAEGSKRTGQSQSDFVEELLRKFGSQATGK